MDSLVAAIVDDDRSAAERLLKKDQSLATRRIGKARLYQSKICHWIYAGDTALHIAAAGYRIQIIRLLLATGADPNETGTHRRSSALHYAADGYINGPDWNETRQVKSLRILLEAGADIEAQDKNGATPLHRSVRTRCSAAVRFLLNAGANPLSRNKPGSTPFHLAVQNTGRGGSGSAAARTAQRRIIEEFLSFGVTPWVKNDAGKTVLESAQSLWIRELLLAAAPQPNGSSSSHA